MRINGHSHLLPYPHEIPKFMKEKEIFWVDDDKKFMRQQSWKRPITDPSFFLNEKLDWMLKNDIDKCVVLNLSQLYCNGFEKLICNDVIRFQNDFNLSLQTNHPDKFISGFVVQPRYVEDALQEIERCVALGSKLLCLPTHFLNGEGKWTSCVDESCKQIFELANEYKLAVEIHPYDAEEVVNLADQYWRFHLIWMCAMTADTHHLYTLLDYQEKYPNIRVCFAHGNQYGQMNIGRRIQGFNGRPDLFPDTKHPELSVGHPNIFFDTLVHDVLSFEIMVKRSGVSQIIAGLDDPYPLGEMESVTDSYPGKVIDDAINHNIISLSEKNAIWHRNVLKWLGNS
jgi:aminocarboxymuconate-semialdehyde decarboxylase